jgi:hypothetical protein
VAATGHGQGLAPGKAAGFWRQLLWPSEPGASLFLVALFWVSAIERKRLLWTAPTGREAWWLLWIACCVLLTAAMVLGLAQRARRAALGTMTGFVVALLASAIWASVAQDGRALSTWGAFVLYLFGVQLGGWWADERAQGATDRD